MVCKYATVNIVPSADPPHCEYNSAQVADPCPLVTTGKYLKFQPVDQSVHNEYTFTVHADIQDSNGTPKYQVSSTDINPTLYKLVVGCTDSLIADWSTGPHEYTLKKGDNFRLQFETITSTKYSDPNAVGTFVDRSSICTAGIYGLTNKLMDGTSSLFPIVKISNGAKQIIVFDEDFTLARFK